MLNPSPEIQTSSHQNTYTKKEECKVYFTHIIPEILKVELFKSMTLRLFKQEVQQQQQKNEKERKKTSKYVKASNLYLA